MQQASSRVPVDEPDRGTPDGKPVSVLGKAWVIIEALADGPGVMGLSELSRRSGVPKASVHRLAAELTTLGLLARSSKGYQLGWRMFELGQRVPGPAHILSAARPVLIELRSLGRDIVHLTVPEGTDCVYLEGLAGRGEAGLINGVGDRAPKHKTASGRLFLAYATPQTWPSLDSEALGALGVETHSELQQHFARIRERRYSEEDQEVSPGFKTIAVPVPYLSPDHIVAAISITVKIDRRDKQQMLHALWLAAGEISHNLRYAGPSHETPWSVIGSMQSTMQANALRSTSRLSW